MLRNLKHLAIDSAATRNTCLSSILARRPAQLRSLVVRRTHDSDLAQLSAALPVLPLLHTLTLDYQRPADADEYPSFDLTRSSIVHLVINFWPPTRVLERLPVTLKSLEIRYQHRTIGLHGSTEWKDEVRRWKSRYIPALQALTCRPDVKYGPFGYSEKQLEGVEGFHVTYFVQNLPSALAQYLPPQ